MSDQDLRETIIEFMKQQRRRERRREIERAIDRLRNIPPSRFPDIPIRFDLSEEEFVVNESNVLNYDEICDRTATWLTQKYLTHRSASESVTTAFLEKLADELQVDRIYQITAAVRYHADVGFFQIPQPPMPFCIIECKGASFPATDDQLALRQAGGYAINLAYDHDHWREDQQIAFVGMERRCDPNSKAVVSLIFRMNRALIDLSKRRLPQIHGEARTFTFPVAVSNDLTEDELHDIKKARREFVMAIPNRCSYKMTPDSRTSDVAEADAGN